MRWNWYDSSPTRDLVRFFRQGVLEALKPVGWCECLSQRVGFGRVDRLHHRIDVLLDASHGLQLELDPVSIRQSRHFGEKSTGPVLRKGVPRLNAGNIRSNEIQGLTCGCSLDRGAGGEIPASLQNAPSPRNLFWNQDSSQTLFEIGDPDQESEEVCDTFGLRETSPSWTAK